ncbi:MAG: Rpn family recombination-promoting nuclease/putative transposase [Acutalibacteraceae bacterium]|nr:Rpn family recombination-promoting nuclease/putative transposase [Acutalibacteraceae bacterium]
MNREEKIVKLKLDVIFKRVFGNAKNEKIIAAFISDLLEIPRESIRAIYISNVELTPEYLDQKFSRLDLKLNVDGRIVNIEMQVNREPDFKERTLFYWAKLYSEELDAGEEYGELKQTICINIINFELFDCEDYHSKFELLESQRKELMTNKLAIHFFELRKLSKFKRNRRMEDWLQLIDAETEGDLMAIQDTTNIPEVKDTIVMLRKLSADDKIRQEAYYREKRLHDEATALGHARREGEAIGMAKGEQIGMAKGEQIGMAKGEQIGMAKGRAAEKIALAEIMRQKGYTETQIRELLGDSDG